MTSSKKTENKNLSPSIKKLMDGLKIRYTPETFKDEDFKNKILPNMKIFENIEDLKNCIISNFTENDFEALLGEFIMEEDLVIEPSINPVNIVEYFILNSGIFKVYYYEEKQLYFLYDY